MGDNSANKWPHHLHLLIILLSKVRPAIQLSKVVAISRTQKALISQRTFFMPQYLAVVKEQQTSKMFRSVALRFAYGDGPLAFISESVYHIWKTKLPLWMVFFFILNQIHSDGWTCAQGMARTTVCSRDVVNVDLPPERH